MKRRRFWSLAGVVGLVATVSLLVVPALGQNPIVAETGELRLDMDSNPDRVRAVRHRGRGATNQQLLAAVQLQTGYRIGNWPVGQGGGLGLADEQEAHSPA